MHLQKRLNRLLLDQKNRDLLESCWKSKQSVFLSGGRLAITFQTYIIAVTDDHVVIENRVKPRFIRQFSKSEQFTLQAQMVRYQTDAIFSDGESIIFPLKENSVIEETRQAERFSFSADERVITEILNPFDNETRLSKPVMDMSATGLSLRTNFDSKLFSPDILLPNIKVLIDGELYIQSSGRVVYSRKLLDLKGSLRTQVGIKFETPST
jgi:hypothetical protein